jgi:hypothetical protein
MSETHDLLALVDAQERELLIAREVVKYAHRVLDRGYGMDRARLLDALDAYGVVNKSKAPSRPQEERRSNRDRRTKFCAECGRFQTDGHRSGCSLGKY